MLRPNREDIDLFLHDVADKNVSRRSLMKKAAALGISIPAAGAILQTQFSGVNAQAAEPTGKLVVSMSVEPDTLENWKAYSTDGHPILRNVQEALLNRDPVSNELVGELATAWEQTDPSTWRFTLRQGVTFHNGDPFNAEVAAFGINYTWSPENQFEIYQFIGPHMNATAVDEYTVDVVTELPDPILPARLYFSPFPNMIQVQERPESLVTEPIGTGPYSFVEWNRGQYIRITANPNWWGLTAEDAGGKVTIKDAEFVFRAESAVRAAQVVAGEAQIGRFLAPEDCATTANCQAVSSVETIFLRLDTNHVAMKDIRIRKAIAMAIDKQTIADELFGGGEAASQLIGPSATGYDPSLTPYPYDMDAAKALVAEAAAEGIPVDAEITVVTREGIYLRNDELAEYCASQLREIGLNCKSEVIEPALYNPEYSTNIKDVSETRGWITTNPHGNEIMDASATASSYYRCDGGASMYCDPALDEALDTAIPLTGEERAAALAVVQKMYYDAYASVPVIHMPLNYGLSGNLQWTPRLDAFMLLKEMTLS